MMMCPKLHVFPLAPQRCLKDETKTLSLKAALAMVRLSHYDPDVFYKFKQVQQIVFTRISLLCSPALSIQLHTDER